MRPATPARPPARPAPPGLWCEPPLRITWSRRRGGSPHRAARHREVLVERNPDWWRRVPGFEDVQPRGFGHLWPCQCGECNDGRVEGISNFCVRGEWRLLEPKKFFTSSKGRDDAFCSPLVEPRVGAANAALKYADEAALKAAKETRPAKKRKTK